MGPKMKIAMTVLPFCMLPLTVNFPMAVTFYWATTNIISLVQAQVLKIKTLRKALKIPELIVHKEKATPGGKKVHIMRNIFNILIAYSLGICARVQREHG